MIHIANQDDKDTIEKTLSSVPQDIPFEEIPGNQASPLSEPVIERGDIKPGQSQTTPLSETGSAGDPQTPDQQDVDEPLDAPRQQIGDPDSADQEQPEFNIPPGHAALMADTILGITNNMLEVGMGFFIKVRKHEEFYEVDEVIQVIDEHNQRSVKRVILDEEDKALIKPLLIQIIRKRGKTLSLEQQILAVLISIIVKKIRTVIEIRSENEILVERIREIIKKEREEVMQEAFYHGQPQPGSELDQQPGNEEKANAFSEAVLEVAQA